MGPTLAAGLDPLLAAPAAVADHCFGLGLDGAVGTNGRGGGWFCYGCALLLLAVAGGVALHWIWEYWRSYRRAHLQALAQVDLHGSPAYVLDLEIPFAAQVGVWNAQLVVSRGLLEQLDDEHLRAVIAHEEAHRHYRDTLWMFGVGWLRRLTGWLPNTEALWQELLTLRELRADRWAAQRVDPLLLGEALLQVVGYGVVEQPAAAWVGFAMTVSSDPRQRLQERIDALLRQAESGPVAPPPHFSLIRGWAWLGLALLPLLAIPFHT